MWRSILLLTAATTCLSSCTTSQKPGSSLLHPVAKPLRSLDWFQGNWVDRDSDGAVHVSFEWDDNHHFLIHTFTVKNQNQSAFQGREIIGWDPAQKEIRSWVFDSDGGFGEGSWSQEGTTWYVRMIYTMPDGKSASSVQVYTQVDPNSYTFASNNREVDGVMLPNRGPFKVVRK